MAQDLPNGFTGFSQRRPNGFVSASAAMGTPRYVGEQPPAGNAANKGAYEAATAAFSSGAEGAFQYARDHARPDGEPAQFDPDKLRLIPDVDRRWSWTEIDLNAIRHNTSAVKQRIDNGVRLMAVVKADGYGHGAVRCAKTALNSGADYLGVATVNEAIELREALVNAPILVLSQPPETAIPLLLAYKVMPSVYTSEFAIQYAEAADAYGVRAPYHLAVNTGMNRIGVRHDEVVEFMGAGELPSRARPRGHVHALRHGRLRGDVGLPDPGEAVHRGRHGAAHGRRQPRHRACGELGRGHPLS